MRLFSSCLGALCLSAAGQKPPHEFPLLQLDVNTMQDVMGKMGDLPAQDLANLRSAAKLFHPSHNEEAPALSIIELYHQYFPFAKGKYDNAYELYRFCIREAISPSKSPKQDNILLSRPLDCLNQVDRRFNVSSRVPVQLFYDSVSSSEIPLPVIQRIVNPILNMSSKSAKKQILYRGVRAERQDIVTWIWDRICPFSLESMPLYCSRALYLLADNPKWNNLTLPRIGDLGTFKARMRFFTLRDEYKESVVSICQYPGLSIKDHVSWIRKGGDSHYMCSHVLNGRLVIESQTSWLLRRCIESLSLKYFEHALVLGLDINCRTPAATFPDLDRFEVYDRLLDFNIHSIIFEVRSRSVLTLSKFVRHRAMPYLFRNGLDVNLQLSLESGAPLFASASEVFETKELLARGADLTLKDKRFRDITYYVILFGHFEKMKILMHPMYHLDFFFRTPLEGITSLSAAAGSGRPDMVQFFLDRGSNVNDANFAGEISLFPALRAYCLESLENTFNKQSAFYVILRQKNLQINARNLGSQSALMVASRWDAVVWLLKYGADPNLADLRGQTALMNAGSVKTVKTLVHCPETNIQQKDLNGQTALVRFVQRNRYDLVLALLDSIPASSARALVLEPLQSFAANALDSFNLIDLIRQQPPSVSQSYALLRLETFARRPRNVFTSLAGRFGKLWRN